MQATDILMQEHRVIEKVLDALETAANRLLAGQVIPMDFSSKQLISSRTLPMDVITRKKKGFSLLPCQQMGCPKKRSRWP